MAPNVLCSARRSCGKTRSVDLAGSGGSTGGTGDSADGGKAGFNAGNPGGSGGGAGAAITGNSNITYLATGTRLGAIS